MYERFTDDCRQVMQLANQTALKWNHEYIETGHILIAMASHPNTSGHRLLRAFGIDPARAREEAEKSMPKGPDMDLQGKLPQTPRAKKVIEYSMEEARNLNYIFVDTDHIVLGLIREQEGVASQVLMNLGGRLEDFRKWVDAAHVSRADQTLKPDAEIDIDAEVPTGESEGAIDTPSLELLIDPGSATREEVAELFKEISTLHRMLGGAGINFVVTDTRLPAAEGRCS